LPTELIQLRNIGIIYFPNVLNPIRGAEDVLMVHDGLLYLVGDLVAFDLVVMIAVDLNAMAHFQSTLRRGLLETDRAASAAATYKSQHNTGRGRTVRRQIPKHWNAKLRSVKDSLERVLRIRSRGG
jgi:hypothetical protein